MLKIVFYNLLRCKKIYLKNFKEKFKVGVSSWGLRANWEVK